MEADKKFVPALRFQWLTPIYDKVLNCTFPENRIKKALLDQGNLQPNDSALDFGCGTGTFLIMGKQQYHDINFFGLDVDNKILQIAKTKIKKENITVELIQYDGGRFPFPDKLFNNVFSTLVFHHLSTENKKVALTEIYRILKNDGELHIADFGKAKNIFTKMLLHFFRFFDGLENTSINAEGKLMDMIRTAGFNKVQSLKRLNTAFGMVELIKATKD